MSGYVANGVHDDDQGQWNRGWLGRQFLTFAHERFAWIIGFFAASCTSPPPIVFMFCRLWWWPPLSLVRFWTQVILRQHKSHGNKVTWNTPAWIQIYTKFQFVKSTVREGQAYETIYLVVGISLHKLRYHNSWLWQPLGVQHKLPPD